MVLSKTCPKCGGQMVLMDRVDNSKKVLKKVGECYTCCKCDNEIDKNIFESDNWRDLLNDEEDE